MGTVAVPRARPAGPGHGASRGLSFLAQKVATVEPRGVIRGSGPAPPALTAVQHLGRVPGNLESPAGGHREAGRASSCVPGLAAPCPCWRRTGWENWPVPPRPPGPAEPTPGGGGQPSESRPLPLHGSGRVPRLKPTVQVFAPPAPPAQSQGGCPARGEEPGWPHSSPWAPDLASQSQEIRAPRRPPDPAGHART